MEKRPDQYKGSATWRQFHWYPGKCEQLPEKLDWQLYSMFQKRRFFWIWSITSLCLIKGTKKSCSSQSILRCQKKAQIKLDRKQGGIIWHTQGSGKTLTMVWLSKWILSNNPDARVLIVTDREELDDQMEKVYKGVEEEVYRTRSGADLIDILQRTDKRLICTLIHKFGVRSNSEPNEYQQQRSIEQFLRELRAALPKDFEARVISSYLLMNATEHKVVFFMRACERFCPMQSL